MIKTENVNINGNEYVITTFDGIKGNLILFKLFKYLRGGASIFNGISLDNLDKSFLDSDIHIGDMLEKIIDNIEPEDFNELVKKLLQNVECNGKFRGDDLIKHHFSANYIEMYQVLIAVIKVNYFNEGVKGFFSQNSKKIMEVLQPKKEKVLPNTAKE